MSGHTPGPWTRDGFGFLVGSTGEQVLLADSGLGFASGANHPERYANARLIAAAPELLSIAERWAALDGGAWHVQRHANEKAELLADTAAVIAKATGEQP